MITVRMTTTIVMMIGKLNQGKHDKDNKTMQLILIMVSMFITMISDDSDDNDEIEEDYHSNDGNDTGEGDNVVVQYFSSIVVKQYRSIVAQ